MIRDLALGLPQPAAAFGSAACCGELKEAHEKPPSQQAGPGKAAAGCRSPPTYDFLLSATLANRLATRGPFG